MQLVVLEFGFELKSEPYIARISPTCTIVYDINPSVHQSDPYLSQHSKVICPHWGSLSFGSPSSAAMSDASKKRRVNFTAGSGSDPPSDSEVILQHDSGATFKVPGLIARDHVFKVPLDHTGEVPGEINLFVREVVSPVAKPSNPYLLFLQGTVCRHAALPSQSACCCIIFSGMLRYFLPEQLLFATILPLYLAFPVCVIISWGHCMLCSLMAVLISVARQADRVSSRRGLVMPVAGSSRPRATSTWC